MKRRNLPGFSLWELMVVVALVIVLLLAAIESLLPLRGAAENATVDATVGGLRSAVGLETARRVLRSGTRQLEPMEGANPVEWLTVPMSNYAGVLAEGDVPGRGQWGFDPAPGLLVYRVRYPEYVAGGYGNLPLIRFRVSVETGGPRDTPSVRFIQLDPVAWDLEGSQLSRWMGISDE